MFPPKLPVPLRGSSPPRNTLLLRPSPLIIQNGISIGSAVLYGSQINAMLYNGKETPQNCLLPLGFRHPAAGEPSHGHKQHAKLVKIARLVPEITLRADRHSHRRLTRIYYFHTRVFPRIQTGVPLAAEFFLCRSMLPSHCKIKFYVAIDQLWHFSSTLNVHTPMTPLFALTQREIHSTAIQIQ